MKFYAATLLTALSSFAMGYPGEPATRQDHERSLRVSRSDSFNEALGQCRGAICGMWGDPHVVTCNGVGYDCQGLGLFTLLDNQMYTVQAHYVDVGVAEHIKVQGWGLTHGASITNDIMIANKETDTPVIQLGFGDMSVHDGTFLGEQGCTIGKHFEPQQMVGTSRIQTHSVGKCRTECENKKDDGCTRFAWYQDGGCFLSNGDDNSSTEVDAPAYWSRTMTGTLDSLCGIDQPLPELADPFEEQMYAPIKKNCPLLMHVDGELIDLSDVIVDDSDTVLYSDDNVEVEIFAKKKKVRYMYTKVNEDGDVYKSEIHLVARGNGPGQLWSCHWDFYICIPNEEEDQYPQTMGLLGSPGGFDWMTPENEEIEVVMHGDDKHKMALDYCYDNWCVNQTNSLMVPPAHMSFEDVKCHDQTFKNFTVDDESCVIAGWKIIEHCKDVDPLLRFACEEDCCVGGAGCTPDDDATDDDTLDKFKDKNDKPQYDVPDHDDCVDGEFFKTGDSVCPDSAESIVTLVKSSGGLALPDDSTVIYGITVDIEPHDTVAGKSVQFRVNNPFPDAANIYVKHDKSVFTTFLDPVCDKDLSTASGCDNTAPAIEAACHQYPGVAPFALVQVYYSSSFLPASDTEVDVCCEPEDGPDANTVMYTFEIKCECPGTSGPVTGG